MAVSVETAITVSFKMVLCTYSLQVSGSMHNFNADSVVATLRKFGNGPSTPDKICRSIDAVVFKNIAFFRNFNTRTISRFDSQTETWLLLDHECSVDETSLAILPVQGKYFLHTIGGCEIKGPRKTAVSALYYLDKPVTDPDCIKCEWVVSQMPPMSTKRRQVTTVCDKKYKHLIAAGGRKDDGPTATVEVLNLATKRWSDVASLPQAVYRASGCVSDDGFLYILGGSRYDEVCNQITTKSAFRVSLSALIKDKKVKYQQIADLPCVRSVCTFFCGQVYAIGGTKSGEPGKEVEPTNDTYLYHPQENFWGKAPNEYSMKQSRCYCLAVSFTEPKSQLMVVGGHTITHDKGCTNTVEITD